MSHRKRSGKERFLLKSINPLLSTTGSLRTFLGIIVYQTLTLKGTFYNHTISFLSQFLQDRCPPELVEKLTSYHTLLKSQSMPQFLPEIDGKAKELAHALMSLNPGEKMLVQGGWAGQQDCHAMLYEFEKQVVDGKEVLCMRVLNTGSGLQYHQAKGIKGKLKYSPAIRYEGIPLDPHSLELFCKANFECQILNNFRGADKLNYNEEYLYEKVFPVLGGKKKLEPAKESDIITAQNAGICAERVLHAHLQKLPDASVWRKKRGWPITNCLCTNINKMR